MKSGLYCLLRPRSGTYLPDMLARQALRALAAIALLHCGTGTLDNGAGPLPSASDAGAPDPNAAGINATGAGAGTGAPTGLPCDVQQLLENRCIGCHMGKSPPALLTLADLRAPSPSNPAVSMAAEAVVRMKDPTNPMPPPPAEAPTADEIAVFQAWVAAGLPAGAACTTTGGTTTTYSTPSVCTSGKTWTGGDRESPSMHPGDPCITCHTMRGGPAFRIAGTVYPTAHEPNDCNGVAGGLTVVVTDAKGAVLNLPVNSVGNFYTKTAVTPPFHVKVTDGTKERAMPDSLTAGDCNSCHTETGVNGAPGRIMAP